MHPIRLPVISAAAVLVTLAALVAGPREVHAQFGGIFGNNPPRPPSNVPRDDGRAPSSDEEEDVPDLPQQGRVLPTPNRPPPPPPRARLPRRSDAGPAVAAAARCNPGTSDRLPGPAPVLRMRRMGPPFGFAPGRCRPRTPPAAPHRRHHHPQAGRRGRDRAALQKITNKQAVFPARQDQAASSRSCRYQRTVQFGAAGTATRLPHTRPAAKTRTPTLSSGRGDHAAG